MCCRPSVLGKIPPDFGTSAGKLPTMKIPEGTGIFLSFLTAFFGMFLVTKDRLFIWLWLKLFLPSVCAERRVASALPAGQLALFNYLHEHINALIALLFSVCMASLFPSSCRSAIEYFSLDWGLSPYAAAVFDRALWEVHWFEFCTLISAMVFWQGLIFAGQSKAKQALLIVLIGVLSLFSFLPSAGGLATFFLCVIGAVLMHFCSLQARKTMVDCGNLNLLYERYLLGVICVLFLIPVCVAIKYLLFGKAEILPSYVWFVLSCYLVGIVPAIFVSSGMKKQNKLTLAKVNLFLAAPYLFSFAFLSILTLIRSLNFVAISYSSFVSMGLEPLSSGIVFQCALVMAGIWIVYLLGVLSGGVLRGE